MRRRGFLGLCCAAIVLAGCGSSTRTVTQTVTRTVTTNGAQAPVSTTATETVTTQAGAGVSTGSSSLAASNGKPWQCPEGDTVHATPGGTVGCYNGSVLDSTPPYVSVSSQGTCPSGTEEAYLTSGSAVCELQPNS